MSRGGSRTSELPTRCMKYDNYSDGLCAVTFGRRDSSVTPEADMAAFDG